MHQAWHDIPSGGSMPRPLYYITYCRLKTKKSLKNIKYRIGY